MATLRKKDVEGGKDEFYFMTREDHCKGFEENKAWTINEWRQDQEADLYDDINRGWMEILIKKKSFGEKEFPAIKNKMFFMTSTDTDYFRAFVFESSFLDTYDIPAERIEKIRTDDAELLKLAYVWLRLVDVRGGDPHLQARGDRGAQGAGRRGDETSGTEIRTRMKSKE